MTISVLNAAVSNRHDPGGTPSEDQLAAIAFLARPAFIMAALDAGVPLRDVHFAARHADPRTTTIYDPRRQNFDRHAAYVVVAFVASG
jgi:hypothetical protein